MIRLGVIASILPYAVFGRSENGVLKDVDKYKEKIVIVGGGIAGVTAAKYLEEAGYLDITILEKEEAVGGKCKTTHYEEYSGYYDLGAHAYHTVYDTHIAGLVEEYNIETESFAQQTSYLVDPLNAETEFWEDNAYLLTSLNESEKQKLAEETDMFIQLIDSASTNIDLPGFQNLDPRLSVSFNQWANENDIKYLQLMLLLPVTVWGYGYLGVDLSDEISLAYVAKLSFRLYHYFGMHNDMVKDSRKLSSSSLAHIKDIGFQGLVKTVADSLQYTNIITSSPVVKVERTDDEVEVQWKTDENIESDIFQKIIVNVPQTIKNLESINMDLSEVERKLFSKVHTRNYYTLLFELECLDDSLYNMVLVPGSAKEKPEITLRPADGFPFGIERLFKKETDDKAMTLVYVYSEEQLSLETVIDNTITYIQSMCNETLRVEDFREAHAWDYMPHVKAEDIGNGFYDQLHSIQGEKNTFWIGGLMNFELTDRTVEYSDYLINQFF